MSFSGRLLTDAIVTLLTNAGLVVGSGTKPATGGWQGTPGESVFTPYVVVYATTGGYFDGPISTPFADAMPDYVISSFGSNQQQAQFTNDLVYTTLTGSKPTAAGMSVELVSPDVEGGVVRDDDVTPAIHYSPTRWRIFTTPS